MTANYYSVTYTAVSGGTKLEKILKERVRDAFGDTVCRIEDADIIMDNIKRWCRELNEQNPKAKPVNVRLWAPPGAYLQWIMLDSYGSSGENKSILSLKRCGMLFISTEGTGAGFHYVLRREGE